MSKCLLSFMGVFMRKKNGFISISTIYAFINGFDFHFSTVLSIYKERTVIQDYSPLWSSADFFDCNGRCAFLHFYAESNFASQIGFHFTNIHIINQNFIFCIGFQFHCDLYIFCTFHCWPKSPPHTSLNLSATSSAEAWFSL